MPEVRSDDANPRRLPRRNHYQEGPGFLFLATQGGRPPEDAARRGVAGTVRRRRAALRRWATGSRSRRSAPRSGCSRATLFRWRTRFEEGGIEGLVDRPRVGRASELPPAIERLILTVRLLTYWNSRRIAAEFGRRDVWPLSHGQVDRLLARHGTHRPSYVRTPGPRYERAAVNELWHIDLKGPFYLLGATGRTRTCHFVALVDDHSRFLLGIRAVPTKEAVWVLALLEEAIELCGVPLELMTDNGTPFVAIVRTMLSRFQRTLDELSHPAHPDPDRHALDERQDRGLLGHAPGGGPRPPAPRRPRRGRDARSPPTPATTTTTGSTASSTGRHRPSASTGRRSPTAASAACHPSPMSPISWTPSSPSGGARATHAFRETRNACPPHAESPQTLGSVFVGYGLNQPPPRPPG